MCVGDNKGQRGVGEQLRQLLKTLSLNPENLRSHGEFPARRVFGHLL